MKEKDYDAIAREIYRDEAISRMLYYDQQEDQCVELIAAILRKHDEAEADGEQYNRPADILAHLKDYPGARDRLIDLLANECWPRSLVADCFAKYDEIQSRPAPTDEKALREAIGNLQRYAFDMQLGDIFKVGHGAFLKVADIDALLAHEAPKDDEQEWLDENGYMPGNDDSLPKANEAPKDESKEGGR